MTSISDKKENLATCEDLLKKAAAAGAKMVFLPEACDYIAKSKEESIEMAESIHGPLVTRYCNLASSLGIWLSLGGLHIKEKDENKVSNTHIVISDKGEIESTYKKTHLFSVHIPEKNLHLEESSYITSGGEIHPPVITPVGKVAMAICYDMRFPELSLIQRRLGAQILTYPSAFTVTTGIAHWETILRCRAIESQCYVIAAAQTGQHNEKRSSYGHSLIVDPWGKVLSEISEGTGIAVADIDLGYVEKIRKEMPVVKHRRSDLYHLFELPQPGSLRICDVLPMPSSYVSYQFGNVSVPGSCIFLKSLHSQAFVNKKPVTPGHVLVTPERSAKRFTDLTSSEICDIVQLTQIVLEIIIQEYEPENVQIALQDGPAAGQTIEHVHFHVVPLSMVTRKKLQGHEVSGKWRDVQVMEEEASKLRQIAINNRSNLFDKPPVIFKSFEITNSTLPKENQEQLHIPDNFLVAKSTHSCSFIAPNPVLPGHICVTTLQNYSSLREVPADVLTDLFLHVQLIQKNIEQIQNTNSSTVIILESLQASSCQYPQVHIIPRVEGDLPCNDDIYSTVESFAVTSSDWPESDQSLLLVEKLRNLIFKVKFGTF
ncbi:nitrilase and fragile histidine triad fusion protein NitFhit [Palaemon carinicauda]|uniref:nitrilase and fragile histidine triad fusion protein NitFhit n=1 Tax=Palaemon carinicauda TaxID=392227 RepID=UPI0035B63872